MNRKINRELQKLMGDRFPQEGRGALGNAGGLRTDHYPLSLPSRCFRVHLLVYALAVFLATHLVAAVQRQEAAQTSFQSLKDYLSRPPAAAEIVFLKTVVTRVETARSWQTNRTLYVGAHEGDSFHLEQRDPQQPDGVPSKVVGRDGALHWHWQLGELRKWEKKADEKVNVVLPLVAMEELELFTALNIGINMLVNSSLKWSGREFEAEISESAFRPDVPPEKARVRISGEFSLSESGWITGLRLIRADVSKPMSFVYPQGVTGSIPSFFPKIARQEFRDENGILQGFIEREIISLQLSNKITAGDFGPGRLTNSVPFVRAVLVYTNNSMFKETTNGLRKVEGGKEPSQTRLGGVRAMLLLVLFVPFAVYSAVWWSRKRSRDKTPGP